MDPGATRKGRGKSGGEAWRHRQTGFILARRLYRRNGQEPIWPIKYQTHKGTPLRVCVERFPSNGNGVEGRRQAAPSRSPHLHRQGRRQVHSSHEVGEIGHPTATLERTGTPI